MLSPCTVLSEATARSIFKYVSRVPEQEIFNKSGTLKNWLDGAWSKVSQFSARKYGLWSSYWPSRSLDNAASKAWPDASNEYICTFFLHLVVGQQEAFVETSFLLWLLDILLWQTASLQPYLACSGCILADANSKIQKGLEGRCSRRIQWWFFLRLHRRRKRSETWRVGTMLRDSHNWLSNVRDKNAGQQKLEFWRSLDNAVVDLHGKIFSWGGIFILFYYFLTRHDLCCRSPVLPCRPSWRTGIAASTVWWVR